MIDNNKIVQILREVKDPKTGIDLISAKRIRDLKISDHQIFFTLEVNDLDQESKFSLNAQCYNLLKEAFKQAEIHIHFASSNSKKTVLPQVKNIIAVGSGKGGVGKSTIAVNLAVTLQKRGYRVGLMDADLYGPSIPTMMQLHDIKPQVQEVYGKPKLIPVEKYGIHLMSIGFIVDPEQAVILRGPRLSGIIKQFVNDCIWPELDFLIVDLPPGTGDIQLTLVQSIPITGAVIVSTPQNVALNDAIKATNMFLLESIKVPILGIVENMAWFTPAELPDNKYYIFGEGGAEKLAKKYKTIVLGQVPLVQGIRESGDDGIPVSLKTDHPMSEIFDRLAQKFELQLKRRLENRGPTQIVHISK